ncbi:hypothetical protein SARC_11095 [Sphaeroforma arctica JP610]|uniref:PLAT domain-containing protein n=1 Tax=Sphaeroforma arctica JP610 TaxID=667725 RepID=A0A0L0FHY4_9EUKA|nr:hypothetical protein SARC_11095 [Sphaeroforma arctica JP610]KNC76402.1 hypothetical protein SARC_11095 [Sphaeroforma arctica JP610]|eukprot:XP_014150304.1 hypothetical protein SARC_11095 [Sphaeroforma arctica JP610]
MFRKLPIAALSVLGLSLVSADLDVTSSVADFDSASGVFTIDIESTDGRHSMAMYNLGGNRVNTHTVTLQTDGPFEPKFCHFKPMNSELYIQSGAKIVDSATKKTYYCSYNGWLGHNADETVTISVLPAGKEYIVSVNTADVPKAGRTGRLNMRLHGSTASTSTESFFINVGDKDTEQLSFYSSDIGKFQSLYMYLDGEDALKIDTLDIKSEGVDNPISFQHDDWLNPNCPYIGHGASMSFIAPDYTN